MAILIFFGGSLLLLLVGFGITGVSVYHWIKEDKQKKQLEALSSQVNQK